MTEEKTCYNCGNKNCNVYYSTVKKDYKRHFEVKDYEYFDCVNHNKWEELKVEEVRTDNTETLKNAPNRIAELEAQIEQLQKINSEQKETLKKVRVALIKERAANIMNYGKGGVEMFDNLFEILKGVSN